MLAQRPEDEDDAAKRLRRILMIVLHPEAGARQDPEELNKDKPNESLPLRSSEHWDWRR